MRPSLTFTAHCNTLYTDFYVKDSGWFCALPLPPAFVFPLISSATALTVCIFVQNLDDIILSVDGLATMLAEL